MPFQPAGPALQCIGRSNRLLSSARVLLLLLPLLPLRALFHFMLGDSVADAVKLASFLFVQVPLYAGQQRC